MPLELLTSPRQVTAASPRATRAAQPVRHVPPELRLELLAIEATNRCNLRCRMCVSHGAGLYRGQADGHPAHIDVDFFKSIVDQYARLPQSGIKTVAPQFQGEPLLHPQFLELCRHIDSRGIRFGFTTNACLLTAEKGRALLDMENFSNVMISIDGATKETYEEIRRGAKYEKVMENVNRFLDLRRRSDFVTTVSFTIQPENEAETEEFVRLWAPRVTSVNLNNIAINGRPQVCNWIPKRIPCTDLWRFMVVLTNGQVVPCCRDYLYQFDIGNLHHTPLEKIWLGEEYRKLRTLHAEGRWSEIPLCDDCDTWMCGVVDRKQRFCEPNITVQEGPFFRTATTAARPKLTYEVIPFEEYHPGPGQPPKPRAAKRRKILFLCYVYPFNAATILDHCESFSRYSENDYYYYNPVAKDKPFWLDLDQFDAVVLHYSVSIIAPGYLDPAWVDAIRKTKALKVLFIQDEYRRVDEHVDRMDTLGIDVLFTCVPYSEVRKVYRPEKLPFTRVFCTMTGFVPESLERRRPNFHRRRTLDVGYRARDLGFWYGMLGQEKRIIGSRFRELAEETGLVCDISTREEDRIYGRDWVRFLENSRCVLGTESGASVFDFTGQIEDETREYVAKHPEATFEDTRDRIFPGEDGKIRLNQISPRVFESIACGACLVMFDGEYSGIVQPDVHFIPLRKDFSNFDEVVAKIRDEDYVRAMAKRAYEDVIRPGHYSYRKFVEGVDSALDQVFVELDRASGATGSQSIASASGSSPQPAPDSAWQPNPAHSPSRSTSKGFMATAIVAARLIHKTGRRVGAGIKARFVGSFRHWKRRLGNLVLGRARRAKASAIRFLTEWQPLYRRTRLKLLWNSFKHEIRKRGGAPGRRP